MQLWLQIEHWFHHKRVPVVHTSSKIHILVDDDLLFLLSWEKLQFRRLLMIENLQKVDQSLGTFS